MRFGPVPLDAAEGAILAHSLQAGKTRLKKGLRLEADSLSQLRAEGIETVIAARPGPGDIAENEAAETIAAAFSDAGLRIGEAATGRVNLFAAHDGLLRIDAALVDQLNAIDPAITFACLPDHCTVRSGDLLATVKIIPLAVSSRSLDAARAIATHPDFAAVRPFRPHDVGMIATRLPTLKDTVIAKTKARTEERLRAYGSHLSDHRTIAHDEEILAETLRDMAGAHDMLLIFGASAVVDRDDVIPAAIRRAGGHVERVGMPVDPGNLLVLGTIDDIPVIGAPGCARSPKENGFDWLLARLHAGETPRSADIARMGVGGLLTEIPSRPQPRAEASPGPATSRADLAGQPSVAVLLLAAGSARRMGESAGHKLLARFDGEPLVRRSARNALASRAEQVIIVTGHRQDEIVAALDGLDVTFAGNPDHAEGIASSLKAGAGAIDGDPAGVMIVLADMPAVTAAHLDRLIDAFVAEGGQSIIRASDADRRGNPVILPARMAAEFRNLQGDVGARALIETSGYPVVDIDIGAAARLDVDTPEAVKAAGGVLESGGD
ncbi:NTP transferase domain-containing protein [Pseudohoeflea coraliihabitans]|uniref:NTP transferase domain-containing protein n=1 Tax=Pseudohoeflea coraliihabitans TaxID=2860393 RepID=UPI002107365B|nr:molybdopterin-binding/glycosyltransferase family 2 protein [Pseudohoeflea sp. DP4N28-3]